MRMAEHHAEQQEARQEAELDDFLAWVAEQERITAEQDQRVSKATASTH